MGTRLDNWLSKAATPATKRAWTTRWKRFAQWATEAENPLTGKPYMSCEPDEVDDVIRKDFEEMPSHLFQDKYRDMLTKYITDLKASMKPNSARNFLTSIRAFFNSECFPIRLARKTLPPLEMAENEHRFTIEEFREMYQVGDREDKAKLSVALSLGWGMTEFLSLKPDFVRSVLSRVDEDGYVAFDYRRKKTRARIRGIFNPTAVRDLQRHLARLPADSDVLWSAPSESGHIKWFQRICREAGIQNGSERVRFHLVRKYVFDLVSSTCGIYEAKLLVGKKIALSDATYLHGIEDRLLARYKKHAYQHLRLDAGNVVKTDERVERLEGTIEELAQSLTAKNQSLKAQVDDLIQEKEELEMRLTVAEHYADQYKAKTEEYETIYEDIRKAAEEWHQEDEKARKATLEVKEDLLKLQKQLEKSLKETAEESRELFRAGERFVMGEDGRLYVVREKGEYATREDGTIIIKKKQVTEG